MPRKPHMQPPAFDAVRPGLWRPLRVDQNGEAGPTRAQARGPGWRKTSHAYYLPSWVDRTNVEQRIVEAGHDLPWMASVQGWASLRWQEALWFDGRAHGGRTELPVPIAVLHGSIREQSGIAVTSEFIPPRDRIVVDGLPVTVPVCALAFEMRYAATPRDAARAFALAAAADLVSTAEMHEYMELLYHWTGIPQLREAMTLAEENAWSPREFDMTAVWQVDAGLSRPLLNMPVFDRNGRHLGTPDLLDPVAGVAGDYDGALHLAGKRRASDLRREDAFRGVGLEYFTIVAQDFGDIPRMVARMHAARSRALCLPPALRSWTVQPPPWWVPTHTVELRRALTPAQRERFLGYRRTA